MPVFSCQCGKKYKLPDTAIGKTAKCSSCQQTFVIQSPQPAPRQPASGQAVQSAPVVSTSRPPQQSPKPPQQVRPPQTKPAPTPVQQVPQPQVPQPQVPVQQQAPASKNPFDFESSSPTTSSTKSVGRKKGKSKGKGKGKKSKGNGAENDGSGKSKINPKYLWIGLGALGALLVAVLLVLVLAGGGEALQKNPVEHAAAKTAVDSFIGKLESGETGDFDLKRFVDVSATGLGLGSNVKENAVKELEEANFTKTAFSELVELAQSGNTKLLRVEDKEDETIARCRFYSGEISPAPFFVDFVLHEEKSGEPLIADYYNYATGERISEKYRRSLIEAYAESGTTDKIRDKDPEFADNIDQIMGVINAAENNYGLTKQLYEKLPTNLQNRKEVLLVYINASGETVATEEDQEKLKTAMEKFLELFPNETPSPLLGIGYYYLLSRELDKALKAIQDLKADVGEDAVLSYLAGSIHSLNDDGKKAAAAYAKSVSLDPDFYEAYPELMAFQIIQNEFGAAISTLKQMKKKFPDFDNDFIFSEIQNGAQFIASPEYRKYKK